MPLGARAPVVHVGAREGAVGDLLAPWRLGAVALSLAALAAVDRRRALAHVAPAGLGPALRLALALGLRITLLAAEALAALALTGLVAAELLRLGVLAQAQAVARERLAVTAAARARGAHDHDTADQDHREGDQQQDRQPAVAKCGFHDSPLKERACPEASCPEGGLQVTVESALAWQRN